MIQGHNTGTLFGAKNARFGDLPAQHSSQTFNSLHAPALAPSSKGF
jgi:hypothetical protein